MTEHDCGTVCVDHWQEPELVCPYCLYVESDSFEVLRGEGGESGQTNCGSCGKDYEYGTTITYADGGVQDINYTTHKLEEQS